MIPIGNITYPAKPRGFITKWTVSGDETARTITLPIKEAPFYNRTVTIITMTNANPGVVTWTSHGLVANSVFCFYTVGALPTNVVKYTKYYVSATGLGTNSFQFSATPGGASIDTTEGIQSGLRME